MLTYMDGGIAITPTSSRSTDSTNTDTQPSRKEHAYTAVSVDSLLTKVSSKEMRGSVDSSAAGAETALLAVSFFLALSLAMLRMM